MYVAYTPEKKIRPTLTAFCENPSRRWGALFPLCASISVTLYSAGMTICSWKLTVLTVGHLAARFRTWILFVLCGRLCYFRSHAVIVVGA